ncbi:cytochrome P450 [Streptomyces diastatochromogenes]|nr:cytochrome P450 [Streptomyces diastatochromogenes]
MPVRRIRPPPVIGAETLRDHAALARLRESGTVEVSLGGREDGLMVTRYGVAAAVLVEPALRGEHPLAVSMRTGEDEEACDEEQLFFLPTEEHRRLRRTVSRHLTHRRVAALVPRVQREADRLLAAVPPGEAVDLVRVFSARSRSPCSVNSWASPGGAGYVRDYLYGWVAEYGGASTVTESAGHALARYLEQLIGERAQSPGDDLISAMLRRGGEDDGPLREDALAAVRFLLVAGHRPVTRLITDGLELLLRQREHWERLVAEPGRLDAAVEELLRHVTPTTLASRYAGTPTEVDGAALAGGDGVHCALAAVNRDPERFEDPDLFDPDRYAPAGRPRRTSRSASGTSTAWVRRSPAPSSGSPSAPCSPVSRASPSPHRRRAPRRSRSGDASGWCSTLTATTPPYRPAPYRAEGADVEIPDHPLEVLWDITYACPLRCTHCYSESGRRPARRLSGEDMLRAADAILALGTEGVCLAGANPCSCRSCSRSRSGSRPPGCRCRCSPAAGRSTGRRPRPPSAPSRR